MQRRLNGLGFDTKVTGKFDDATRAVITRWQAARGYPTTGFLNKLQHKALLTEIVATTQTSSSDNPTIKPARRVRAAAAAVVAGRRERRRILAPFVGGVMGGMMGGLFRH